VSGYETARRDIQAHVKVNAETRNSGNTGTTLTVDLALSPFNYTAGVIYQLDAALRIFGSAVNIDFKWKFVPSAGTFIRVVFMATIAAENAGFVAGLQRADFETRTPVAIIPFNVVQLITIRGMFQSNESGTLEFHWAQNTLSANSMQIADGSWMDFIRAGQG